MLNKNVKTIIKATMKSIIVALIYSFLFFGILFICFNKSYNELKSTIDLISIVNKEVSSKDVLIDEESHKLVVYPEYGTKYATLQIPSLNIDLPVFFGDSMSILKHGIGHSSSSYFPGEGGSILYMGHNNVGVLSKLKNIDINSEIIVQTSYGTFTYKVYDHQIINYKETDKVPTNKDEEILMLYTCFQTSTFGHTEKRFVVYAKLENSEYRGES